MLIHIQYWNQSPVKNQIERAISALNAVQNFFYFIGESTTEEIIYTDQVNWETFRQNFQMEDNEYYIGITDKQFDDNWFSHEERHFALISVYGWERYFAPPSVKANLIYQISQAAICFSVDLSEEMELQLIHGPPEGCMFDLCVDKQNIHLGMISGSICPQCRGTLLRYGIDEKAVFSAERMLDYVRAEAIGKPVLLDEGAAFVVMRYTNNDENDHAFKYGIIPALKKLNITCRRADKEISSGQILNKVIEAIRRCRFIIVKIDTNNLNTYFELGVAIGFNKDILLISDEELVNGLATDIRNCECLTYERGNYENLRDRIIYYFRSNFHY